MNSHPEAAATNLIEPTVGEHLRLAEFLRKIEKLDRDELLEITKLLAKQALVSHPSVIRYLAHEAARNLGEKGFKDWTEEVTSIKGALLENDP
jgi:hypothetical protein